MNPFGFIFVSAEDSNRRPKSRSDDVSTARRGKSCIERRLSLEDARALVRRLRNFDRHFLSLFRGLDCFMIYLHGFYLFREFIVSFPEYDAVSDLYGGVPRNDGHHRLVEIMYHFSYFFFFHFTKLQIRSLFRPFG